MSWNRSWARRTPRRTSRRRSELPTEAQMVIALKTEEQELLREEVSALLQAFPDDAVRARYAGLADGVERGEVPDEALEATGELLELGLQSGRIRRQHRAN